MLTVLGAILVTEVFAPLLNKTGGYIVNVSHTAGPTYISTCSPGMQRQLCNPVLPPSASRPSSPPRTQSLTPCYIPLVPLSPRTPCPVLNHLLVLNHLSWIPFSWYSSTFILVLNHLSVFTQSPLYTQSPLSLSWYFITSLSVLDPPSFMLTARPKSITPSELNSVAANLAALDRKVGPRGMHGTDKRSAGQIVGPRASAFLNAGLGDDGFGASKALLNSYTLLSAAAYPQHKVNSCFVSSTCEMVSPVFLATSVSTSGGFYDSAKNPSALNA